MKNSGAIRNKIFKYAKEKFGTEPEYLWVKFPNYAVLRNPSSSKWYGIVMDVKKQTLGLKGEGHVDILNVKCDPLMIGSLLNNRGYFAAYHMNKNNWITILLDGAVSEEEIFKFIDLSYEMTQKKNN